VTDNWRLSKKALPDSCDVVVLGAGVSGLLIAGELAKRHSVVVLEKAERASITKYWLTDRGAVDANQWLASAIDTTYDEMAFTAYDGTSYAAHGDYVLWNSDQLLDLLGRSLASNAASVVYGQQFYSLRSSQDNVTVHANAGAIRCRLLIDCMGHESPIIYAKNVISVAGFYLLYGATFPCTRRPPPVALHNVMLSNHPGYLEVFPTADGRVHMVLIVPTSTLRPVGDLRKDFEFIVAKSPYAEFIDSPASKERRFLGGIVPVGKMRRLALDGVFFFGEAGQVNPAASATALTRMLYSYRDTAAHLSHCLSVGNLSARALAAQSRPAVGRFNQRLQRMLFRSILRWSSDDFRRVVEELTRIDDDGFVNHLVFGSLPERSSEIARYARRLVVTRSTVLGRAFARSLFI
jgi:Lycopene cyclase protein